MGAEYYSSKKYAIKYADFVTHSYHPVKAFTTGEGGSVISKNKKISKKIELMRNHSMIKSKKFDPWIYKIQDAGMNYRITDIQCALGLSQLNKLNKFIKSRRQIAKIYLSKLEECENFINPIEKKNCKHSYHLYPLQILFDKIKINKKELFYFFRRKGILLQVHYIPIHLQPFYAKNFNINRKLLTNSENFYKREVSLPIFPDLRNNELNKIIKNLKLINKKI